MKSLIQRLTTGWSLMRVFFTFMGGYMIVNAVIDAAWIALIPGTWFFSMGLLGFGCAGGNCAGGNCQVPERSEKS